MDKKCPQCGASLPAGALDGLCPACLLKQGAAAETGSQPRAAAFVPPTVEEMAVMFPHLEILSLIGRGGMGAVYKARQPALDRIVALKILPPQAATGSGFSERFGREARALARLSHPNIVVLHEFGQVRELPYFIMEYVDGLNLRQLEQNGRLPAREALAIIPQICEALQFAHDAGVVHRDVKPENILIDKAGRVKIADFGIAKMIGGGGVDPIATATGHALGTPHYMAPEQVASPESVDHRADIYPLGVVFYEMLTGELPMGKFAPPSRRVQVDVRLDDVVLRALEREPQMRFQQVSEVRTRLQTIAGDPGPMPAADAAAFREAVLARTSVLRVGSCFRRGWTLVKSDFWPTVIVTAVIIILANGANILGGPLMGGLWLFHLNRIRGRKADMETAFSGFRIAFLPLFLGGLVSGLLTAAGFVCFVLPGLYLLVAWMFTLALIADKGLDFWPAMELSRRVITRQWFRFLLLFLGSIILNVAGAVCCVVGVFLALPVTTAALMYAYEDLVGAVPATQAKPGSGAALAPAADTVRLKRGDGARGRWIYAVACLALLILVVAVLGLALRSREQAARAREAQAFAAASFQETPKLTNYVFGRTLERVISDPDDEVRNSCLDLDTGKLMDLPVSWPNPTASNEAFSNAWASLPPLLTQQGVDVVGRASRSALEVFSGPVIAVEPGLFDTLKPEQVANPSDLGGQPRESPTDARHQTLTITNPPAAYLFNTHAGTPGVMQVTGFTAAPRGVRLRYKLVEARVEDVPAADRERALDDISVRLEAAEHMLNSPDRDQALASIAARAAKAGAGDVTLRVLQRIINQEQRNAAAEEAARQLLRLGLRRSAIAVANSIPEPMARDRVLREISE